MGAIAKAVIAFESEQITLKKDGKNTYLDAQYSTLENLINSTRKELIKHGLAIVSSSDEGSMGCIKTTTRLIHSSGEWIEVDIPILVAKQDPQSCGSAITYGRRYGLQGLLNLPSEDDDGESAMNRPKTKTGDVI
jgi:hypothetical protein